MKKSLKKILPLAEGIARLLYPFGEAVLHDLETDTIAAIFNPISKRQVGDDSYLDQLNFNDGEDVIGPYERTNWDGRPLKSISVVVRNEQGKAEGFICINLDISVAHGLQNILSVFLNNNASLAQNDKRFFKENLYERMNSFVQNYCRENQVSFEALTRQHKQELINLLEAQGAFEERNAATYIGRVLKISRATVYNYLKQEELDTATTK